MRSFSPLSVSLALAMTCNGAAGDTRTAIAKTLGAASLTDEAINRNSRLLLDMVEKADPQARIEVANALWTQSGFPINPDFLKLNRDYYDASVEVAQPPPDAAHEWSFSRFRPSLNAVLVTSPSWTGVYRV